MGFDEGRRLEQPSDPNRPERRTVPWNLAGPLLILVAAIVPYLPTLSYQFLNWDDAEYVVRNPWIRGWSLENLTHIFQEPYFANFLPLHLVSYMVDYSLWGLDPYGYHLHSVLLHALNALLALLVVKRLFGSAAVALLAALLFAVHPSHVEAVAWISIRKDLLSTTFALLTVYLYLRATGAASFRWPAYFLSVLCFTLGLLSKVSIAALPLFLLLLDGFKSGGKARTPWTSNLANKIPYVLVGLWLVGLNSLAQAEAMVGAPPAQDALSYAMVKGHAAWNYLGLLVGALRGSPVYDTPVLGKGAAAILTSVAGLVLLPAGAWLALHFRNRVLGLCMGWIFITLIPALVFPLATFMADRYLYASSLGLCWLIAAGIVALCARVPEPRWRALAVAGMALVPLGGFLARTVQALPVWRDSESLWTYVLTRSGDHRAYTNLAEVRLQQKRWDEAEQLLRISARVDDVTTYQNLGVLYFQTGRYPEAVGALDRALAILRRQGWRPAQASVLLYSLGAIYWRLGQTEKTLEALEAALREDPSNAKARETLGIIRGSLPGP